MTSSEDQSKISTCTLLQAPSESSSKELCPHGATRKMLDQEKKEDILTLSCQNFALSEPPMHETDESFHSCPIESEAKIRIGGDQDSISFSDCPTEAGSNCVDISLEKQNAQLQKNIAGVSTDRNLLKKTEPSSDGCDTVASSKKSNEHIEIPQSCLNCSRDKTPSKSYNREDSSYDNKSCEKGSHGKAMLNPKEAVAIVAHGTDYYPVEGPKGPSTCDEAAGINLSLQSNGSIASNKTKHEDPRQCKTTCEGVRDSDETDSVLTSDHETSEEASILRVMIDDIELSELRQESTSTLCSSDCTSPIKHSSNYQSSAPNESNTLDGNDCLTAQSASVPCEGSTSNAVCSQAPDGSCCNLVDCRDLASNTSKNSFNSQQADVSNFVEESVLKLPERMPDFDSECNNQPDFLIKCPDELKCWTEK